MTHDEYLLYLQSLGWKRRRAWVLIFWDHRCAICNAPKPEVHHRTYERLGHELLTDCIPLCDECHELYHEHDKAKTAIY